VLISTCGASGQMFRFLFAFLIAGYVTNRVRSNFTPLGINLMNINDPEIINDLELDTKVPRGVFFTRLTEIFFDLPSNLQDGRNPKDMDSDENAENWISQAEIVMMCPRLQRGVLNALVDANVIGCYFRSDLTVRYWKPEIQALIEALDEGAKCRESRKEVIA